MIQMRVIFPEEEGGGSASKKKKKKKSLQITVVPGDPEGLRVQGHCQSRLVLLERWVGKYC